MEKYTTQIGADRIAWLTHPASPIGCAGLLNHVTTPPDRPDGLVFSEAVAGVLRGLPEDHDGHLGGDQIWFGGLPHQVQEAR